MTRPLQNPARDQAEHPANSGARHDPNSHLPAVFITNGSLSRRCRRRLSFRRRLGLRHRGRSCSRGGGNIFVGFDGGRRGQAVCCRRDSCACRRSRCAARGGNGLAACGLAGRRCRGATRRSSACRHRQAARTAAAGSAGIAGKDRHKCRQSRKTNQARHLNPHSGQQGDENRQYPQERPTATLAVKPAMVSTDTRQIGRYYGGTPHRACADQPDLTEAFPHQGTPLAHILLKKSSGIKRRGRGMPAVQEKTNRPLHREVHKTSLRRVRESPVPAPYRVSNRLFHRRRRSRWLSKPPRRPARPRDESAP